MSGRIGAAALLAMSSLVFFFVIVPAQGGDVRFNDCNENGINDICDIDCDAPGCDPGLLRGAGVRCGESLDCNYNWIPDECELEAYDCNENGVPDSCDIADETSDDENHDGIPDECQYGLPTVSEWGLVVFGLLILTAGTVTIQRRPRVYCSA